MGGGELNNFPKLKTATFEAIERENFKQHGLVLALQTISRDTVSGQVTHSSCLKPTIGTIKYRRNWTLFQNITYSNQPDRVEAEHWVVSLILAVVRHTFRFARLLYKLK